MIPRWQLKENARKLRKSGRIYKEISEQVLIHRTTLSRWCKDIELTPEQIASRGKRYASRLKGAKANQVKRDKEIRNIQANAKKEAHTLTDYEFKIAGAALYWAEGDKAKKDIAFSNSNPEMIRFIIKWLREICDVPKEKIRAALYLHTGLDEDEMKKYWSRIANVPSVQFGKTIFKQEGSASRKYSKHRYKGTISIRISNRNLKHKISSWIEQLSLNR